MGLTDSASRLTRDFLVPLCAETSHLFTPVKLYDSDRISLSLSDDGKKFHAEIFALKDGVQGYASWEARGRWVTRVPERKELMSHINGCAWQFAATDFTALIINAVWSRDRISFESSEAELTYDCLLANFVVQAGTARAMAEYKHGNGPAAPFTLSDSSELPLNGYQQIAAMSAYKKEGYGFFMEQGTGKTPPVVNRICNEARALRTAVPDEVVKQAQDVISIAQKQADEKGRELLTAAETRCKAREKELLAGVEDRAKHRKVELNFEGIAVDLMREAQLAILRSQKNYTDDLAGAHVDIEQFKQQVMQTARDDIMIARGAIMHQAERRAAALKAVATTDDSKPKRMYRALIVAPRNVRINWRNEICRFAFTPGKVVVLRGGALERTKLLIEAFAPDDECEWTIVIASYESIMRTWDSFQMIEWDLCVLDESQFIKSPTTKRTKQILELRDLCKQRMCLTGTPIANTLFDIYTQFEFMGEGYSGFQSFKAFKTYYGQWTKYDNQNKLSGYQNVPLLQERLARLTFMITKAEALPDLPKQTWDIWEVEMSDEQTDLYKQVRDKLVAEIEADLQREHNRQLVVTNVLTKLLRLSQITSGFISWDPIHGDDGEILQPKSIDRLDPNPKLDALVELLQGKEPDQKTIIWACWVQDIKSIKARLDLEGIDNVVFYGDTSDDARIEAERRFNADPNCRVFIGNAAAGGVGLNLVGFDWWEPQPKLTTNTDHTIYFSQNWSMIHRGQSEGRPHRMTTRVPQRYTDLCVPGTIDEEIRTRVLNKKMTALAIQDIRVILTRVLETRTMHDA
jgi:hypothetical protein